MQMTQENTFLFHDYETWGVNPAKDYPCQFAAIRTDAELNPIGEPINIMSQIPNDYLPSPQACLVTGITPQQSLSKGLNEAEFAKRIFDTMSQPNTCSLGYNSIRFDDEVSRYLFYRNFYDPYAREWQNGNSRWDIIDLARACYALRPENTHWPKREDGSPSFKLEHLTEANNIEHVGAHDALADVFATIELAKHLKKEQPRLFDYALSLRNKQAVWAQINLETATPLLHISSKIPAKQGCTTYVLPIAQHPSQSNAVICIDLSKDSDLLLQLSAEEIRERLYSSAEVLGDAANRPGLKLIHVNRSPFITSAKALSEQRAEEIGVDRSYCLQNYQKLIASSGSWAKLVEVFTKEDEREEQDAEHALYSGGFLSKDEKSWCEDARNSSPEQLINLQSKMQNPRLRTLLFRYRARHYSTTLGHEEVIAWQAHRQERFVDGKHCLSLRRYMNELENLSQLHQQQPQSLSILKALYQYAQSL